MYAIFYCYFILFILYLLFICPCVSTVLYCALLTVVYKAVIYMAVTFLCKTLALTLQGAVFDLKVNYEGFPQ